MRNASVNRLGLLDDAKALVEDLGETHLNHGNTRKQQC